MTTLHRLVSGIVTAAVLAVVTTGCGVTIPSDPDGTLSRIVSSGELRAGASPAGDALSVDGQDVSGPLASLVEGFAAEQGARVAWVVAGEESLVDDLEAGDIDLAVGGMTTASPWSERVSVTRGYDGIVDGDDRSFVVLLPLGENALQVALEAYLDREARR